MQPEEVFGMLWFLVVFEVGCAIMRLITNTWAVL